ncbi:MAG: rhaA [Clostridia bacterium]|jgi:L-rhamnose isomerase|nr:rhaA [Clostridia bacterium]
MKNLQYIEDGYKYACSVFKEMGVDVELAMEKCDKLPISMHCWQGDDGVGFDGADVLKGGILTTGNYPGRARTPEELRQDISKALQYIPGEKKLNLHACYAELGDKKGKIDRDEYSIDQFRNWLDFAKKEKIGMDFNPTFYGHSKYEDALTLSNSDEECRKFWIEHGKRCREIGAEFGKELGKPCVINFWMPDGYKDIPADTFSPRKRMIESLDEIFATEYDKKYLCDAVESKLFGIGLESYTVASHEFSYGYAMTRNKTYCFDAGHFHPTETISAKFSAALNFCSSLLLHVSRGVRWDSDHVITFDDELINIMNEIVTNGFEDRMYIALDYFDASINRIMAWVIGMRNARKALLYAYLKPTAPIKAAECTGDYSTRLALMEEVKNLPYAAIWNYYCMKKGVGVCEDWLEEVKEYEKQTFSNR